MKEKIQLKAQEILEAALEEGGKIFVEEVEPGIYYAGIETNRRGPGAVIIGEDLTYLYGTSAIGYSQLLEEFRLGKRTLDNNLKLSNGKYATDEETKKAYEEYMKEIDRYNEQVANGETPNVKLGDLLNKYRDTFYDEELENKVKKIDEDYEKNKENNSKEIDELINQINEKLRKIEKLKND